MTSDQTYKLNLSDWVIRDIQDRMFDAIFECQPTAIIKVGSYIDGRKTTSVIANLRGWKSLVNECKITADNWYGEYSYDKSNKEAKAEFNRFATAASRIQILINEITKVQEEDL